MTHLCLVSGQPIPNLTPALDSQTAPRRVILLVSADMHQRAEWLAAVLRPRGIKVDTWPLDNAWDIEHVELRVMELLEHEHQAVAAQSLVLNATGGTKPMSIAAYEAFRAYGLPVFYVHPEQDQLIWLSPRDLPTQELENRAEIDIFLQVHGAVLKQAPRRNVPDAARLALAQEIVLGIEGYGQALKQLNWLAMSAGKGLRSEVVPDDRGALGELIDRFAAMGSLVRDDDGRLCFPDEAERVFVNGGWIEAYVFDIVRQLRRDDPHIQDVAYAVEVEREQRGKPIPNEMDVVFLRNNRLHIIECKTKRFRDNTAAGSEALYKLDALRDLMGGLQARAMLLSFLDVPGHDRVRAGDLHIHVCGGLQLRQIKDHICRFIA